MRKLSFTLNVEHLRRIKPEIVPALFTEHQFRLLEKRFLQKRMSSSEKNEFSRAISRKMKAIYMLLGKEPQGIFAYGKERIRPGRLKKATHHLHLFSRIHKGKHVLITGSFLYKEKYNDIDVFVVTKYDKEDYQAGDVHVNYLKEDVYGSLFWESIGKLCISNRPMGQEQATEKADGEKIISLYQELFNDIDKKFLGVKKTLREFLLQAASLSKSPLPASDELAGQVDAILRSKNPKKIVQKIFVHAIVIGIPPKRALREMQDMISSYKETIKEYRQHKAYYLDLIHAFEEVKACATG